MQKKQVIYLSFISLLFSLIFPFLAIAPVVYFILSKNNLINWIIFLSIFCIGLLLIYFIGYFNSSLSLEATALSYLYNLIQFLLLPFLFAFIYYFFILAYKKYNSSLILFIVLSAIPFAVLIVFSLILLKSKGFSFVQFSPTFENLFGKDYSQYNIEAIFQNLINKEIPKSISLISISLALIVEQQLISFTKKSEPLKYIIKPLDSTKLGKVFSWITIIVIYSLIALKFILKINNFTLELILFNLFYLLTTIHFINGLGVITFNYKKRIKPIVDNQLVLQLKSRPLIFLLVIIALFTIILILIPFILYIYFIVAFVSVIDTIYPLRKEIK
ncbi:MAG: hypothetical protein WH035_00090 [Spirochaetota bacterium]